MLLPKTEENKTRQGVFPYVVEDELQIVQRLVQAVIQAGISNDPVEITNVYVSLKSKPLAILAGPSGSGKLAMIQCLTRILTGGSCEQCQYMTGHLWNGGTAGSLAFYSEIHTRYNSEKLLCLIEEAWRPENAGKVFVACLARISPAEVATLFSELSYQLRHNEIVRFGDVHFSTPLPYPANLFLIGTMDTDSFTWWDNDLLANTTVMHWTHQGRGRISCLGAFEDPASPIGRQFLISSTHSRQGVYQKLHWLLSWEQHPMEPLFQLEEILVEDGVQLPQTSISEAMTYIANSWSRNGQGLFNPSVQLNLKIALDLAISQMLLPHAAERIRSSVRLAGRLSDFFDVDYPRSAMALHRLAFRRDNSR